jgi:hypothetical protein
MPRRQKPGPKGKRGRPRGIRIQGEFGCKVCQHAEAARINFLLASGGNRTAIAAQFGVTIASVTHHYHRHITARYKRIVGATRIESFEALLARAAEGDSETLDILALLVRGHTAGWALGLETNDAKTMALHAARILQASELKSKITRELTGPTTIQIHSVLTADAAQLVAVLESFPEAAQAVIEWHRRRTTTTRVIEHSEHAEHANAAD